MDDPPALLGIGSYGVVLRGTYRGSAVALKRAHRLLTSAPAAGSASTDAGAPSPGLLSWLHSSFNQLSPKRKEPAGGGQAFAAPKSPPRPPQTAAAGAPSPLQSRRALRPPPLVAPSVLQYVQSADELRAAAAASSQAVGRLGSKLLHNSSGGSNRSTAVASPAFGDEPNGQHAKPSLSSAALEQPEEYSSESSGPELQLPVSDAGKVVESPSAAIAEQLARARGSKSSGDASAWLEAISAFSLEAHQMQQQQGRATGTGTGTGTGSGRATADGTVLAALRGTSYSRGAPRAAATGLGSGFESGAWWRRAPCLGRRRVGMMAGSDVLEEVKRAVALRHPRIVSVLGAVVERNSEPVLVIELMDRGNLQELLLNQASCREVGVGGQSSHPDAQRRCVFVCALPQRPDFNEGECDPLLLRCMSSSPAKGSHVTRNTETSKKRWKKLKQLKALKNTQKY